MHRGQFAASPRRIGPGLVCALAAVAVLSASPGAATRAITAADYYAFEYLSDPQLSPDGSFVAYEVTAADPNGRDASVNVWVVKADGSAPARRTVPSLPASSMPRWSPDGKRLGVLAPVTAGAGRVLQVHVGEPGGQWWRPVTRFDGGVSTFAWSPDGARLVTVSRMRPSARRERPPFVKVSRAITHLIYRSRGPSPWLDDRRSHLSVVDVQRETATQLTDGDDWDDDQPEWSPDGREIVFVSDRTGQQYDARGDVEVYVVAAGGGPVRKVSNHQQPAVARLPRPAASMPRWSPDQKRIAFLSMPDADSLPRIWVADNDGHRPPIAINPDLDVTPSGLQWTPDGRAVMIEASVKGERHVFRADLASKQVTPVIGGARFVKGFDVGANERLLAFVASDFQRINDLYVSDGAGRAERRVAGPQNDLWKSRDLATVERFSFKGADAVDIEAFFVKPSGWRESARYPMILVLHGGPSYMYGMDWEHEFQLYAAHGWAVLYMNPRGSTGYGEQFQRLVKGEWGGKAFDDVMKGVDAALARYPWVDGSRLGVTGLSYGGFLTNWIVGHTDRFRAAVTVNGISNPVSQEGTRFAPFARVADFGGTLWDAYPAYWHTAPLQYARHVKTPTLILHAEHDFMVSLEQGEQWYRALKYFDVPTELVVFPGSNHFGLNSYVPMSGREPRNVVEALEWRLHWFHRYFDASEKSASHAGRTPPRGR